MTACSPSREKIPAVPVARPPSSKLVIYQLMTRLFGNTHTTNKPFGTIQENGVGKFNHLTGKAFSGIKELGVTHIWYTGIIEHASLTGYAAEGIAPDAPDVVKGIAGSPYAIRDYYDVDPDLAMDVRNRLQEFEALVQRTHEAGLGVLIDFVPNHVARRYHSDVKPEGVNDFGEGDDVSKAFFPSNNFYYLPGQSFRAPVEHGRRMENVLEGKTEAFEETPAKVTGDDQFVSAPSAGSWFDAVKLNYGVDYQNGRKTYFDPVPDTWTKMKEILVYWVGKKVDGFRCDMAEMVPVEFWNWVIPQVKAINPEVLFIAEIYDPARYRSYVDQGRFDILYDKVQLYDTLRLLIEGQAIARTIGSIYKAQEGLHHRLLHFMENHDEQRIASPFFAGDPFRGLPAMLVSATIDSGPVMIYFGQEVGEPGDEDEGYGNRDGRTTLYDYWGVPEHQKWLNLGAFDGGKLSDEQKRLRESYVNILQAARNEEAIKEGDFIELYARQSAAGGATEGVVSFARYTASEGVIIVAGFNPRAATVNLEVPSALAEHWKVKPGAPMIFKDLLGDTTTYKATQEDGVSVSLPAYGIRMLKWKTEDQR